MKAPALVLLCALAVPASAERSADGRLRWEEGDHDVTVLNRGGFSMRGNRVKLPPLEKGARRRVVFAPSGGSFAVLDQQSDSVGLHTAAPRGSRGAQAVVTGATLRLMEPRGRVLWTRTLPETFSLGGFGVPNPIVVGSDGTAALLMQDADPYSKAKPMVLVFDPKGKETLRLDYTAWSRIDEMLLSSDGRWLALRGIGRVPEIDSWGSALGHYDLKEGGRTIKPSGAAAGGRTLRSFDAHGTVCCLLERHDLAAYDRDGLRTVYTEQEAEKLFGPVP